MKVKALKDIENRLSFIKDERQKKIINSIISKEDWYKCISLDTFMSILSDLNYSKDEALSIYRIFMVTE